MLSILTPCTFCTSILLFISFTGAILLTHYTIGRYVGSPLNVQGNDKARRFTGTQQICDFLSTMSNTFVCPQAGGGGGGEQCLSTIFPEIDSPLPGTGNSRMETWDQTGSNTKADSMHPTRMLSCLGDCIQQHI